MNKSLLHAASSALRLTVLLGLTAGIMAAQPAPNSDSSAGTDTTKKTDEPQKLEKFEVTGSRIKRLDAETPAPVVTYTSVQIEEKGYQNLGDFVQSLPFNTSTTNQLFQSNSFTAGAVTANPRGLGGNRFLVLLNGRRAVSYARTQSNNNSVFDFNSIPLEAIDSIEYLKDGASAIYGSDAITGVMNIKLKKNFSGLETSFFVGNTIGHDSLVKSATAMAGAQSGKTSIMVGLSYAGTNSNFIKDYDRSKQTNYSLVDPAKGSNQESTLNFPANVNLTAAQAAAAGYTTGSGIYVISGGTPTANPTKAMFGRVSVVPDANRYDFAKTYQIQPDTDNYSVFGNVEHEFNEHITAFAQVMYADNFIKYSFTPSVIQSTQNPGTGPTGLLNIPATNPYNPFGIDITNFLYRTNFGPPRKTDIEAVSGNFLAGLKGDINSDWSWESGMTYGYSNVAAVNHNYIRAADLQKALNGTSRTTALNPFGPSDNPALVSALFTNSNSNYRDFAYDGDLSASGHIFELPSSHQQVGVAAGLEWRFDKLDQEPDTAAYVGQGGGAPLMGSRHQWSGYAELSIPILVNPFGLEVQIAGRHEDYSDFGKTNKPKYAAKLRLPKNDFVDVILRGSYSESFKAPDLGRLYASQTVGFSPSLLQDPLRPQDPATQMRIVTGGNPGLQPELGKVKYAGVVFESPKIKDLSIGIDYVDITITNAINTPSSTFLLSEQGRTQFPQGIVRDNTQGNPGPILYLYAVPFNLASQWYKGWDLDVNYTLRHTRVGDFNIAAAATYITSSASDSGLGGGKFENVGLYYNPRLRATGTATWRYRDWRVAVGVDYTGKWFNDGYTAAGWGENPKTIVNPSITYKGLWNTEITLGATNVFDTQPGFNGFQVGAFDPNITQSTLAMGRFVYLHVKKSF